MFEVCTPLGWPSLLRFPRLSRISQVVSELMSALWSLMKPNTALGFKALTVLGKLGGRNRRFLLNQPPRLEYRDNPEHGFR